MAELKLRREKYFFVPVDDESKEIFDSTPIGTTITAEIDVEKNPKTPKQRKALHVWFELLAEILNDAGLDKKVVLEALEKYGLYVPWSKESVKEDLYKPVMKAMTTKESTEQLNTKQPKEVCKVLGTRLSESLGITPPDWPHKPTEEESRYDNPKPKAEIE